MDRVLRYTRFEMVRIYSYIYMANILQQPYFCLPLLFETLIAHKLIIYPYLQFEINGIRLLKEYF